jgi:dihydroneopterin aldolase/2-amino-4-hydroxy-6-hydroxymethyldihydropteridine diphosphokinase/dihydropteroate synthase
VETSLSPGELIDAIKAIENDMGRQQTVRNGPRIIDIDIISYGSDSMNIEGDASSGRFDLHIPHPRFQEREFVLRPLLDIDEQIMLPLAGTKRRVSELLNGLMMSNTSSLRRVIPCGKNAAGDENLLSTSSTLICGVLNATPDRYCRIIREYKSVDRMC